MAAPTMQVNAIGLELSEYKGRPSSLCPGCGHNSIAAQIVSVAYEMSIKPYEIIKMSGIGCSSKSPAYFLGQAHGFNALHGRMPSVTTGAVVVNRSIRALGVSGDGDSGSIGMGQFKHVVRRNMPMVYIIENNGVYGLTKGQHSATQDEGVIQKYYGENKFPAIDLALEAVVGDASFVARSFAGAPKQVRELLKAALSHDGLAVLDIISPCVAFNDTPESTKSYRYARKNTDPLHDITYVPHEQEILIDETAFDTQGEMRVELHDGASIVLKKLDEDYDPTDRNLALRTLEEAQSERKIITGLIFYDDKRPTLHETENMIETPLVELGEDVLRPSAEALEAILDQHR